MVHLLVLVLLSALFVEGFTELLCKSKIFNPLRERLSRTSNFIAEMLSCAYCASVWVSLVPSFLLAAYKGFSGSFLGCLIIFPFLLVIIHRLANYIHNFNDKFLDKYYDSRFNGSGD
jgi:hypothetical protein